ncbi:HlyD family efflux transporter periplasmic adaptor subunit [Raoultella sp. RIT712]|uniref:HlyD family efflux transporter periplasmic adaptor subunit n=1 Tax=Raoultella sp. RIT712 TaxID=2666191 RepID=UPI0012AD5179|nr:HlyD family efflux transporter periplasmic adaptor subunit [Raoultella sp. RIT712]MRT47648.1 HlyD family efflux transporter periplasmic adaptor subunit [Raoultella sp. RIT712]
MRDFNPLFITVSNYNGKIYYYLMLVVFVFFLIVCAFLIKIDIVTSGEGAFKPEFNYKQVKIPVDGVISKVYVKEGDEVNVGQILFSISMDKDTVEYENLKNSISKVEKMHKSLNSILESGEKKNDSRIRIIDESGVEYDIALDKMRKFHNEVTIKKIEIDRVENDIQRKTIESNSMKLIAFENKRQLSNILKLQTKGYVTSNEVESLKHELRLSVNNVDLAKENIKELELRKIILNEEYLSIVNGFNDDINSRLYELTQQLHELKIRKEYVNERLKYKNVYSVYKGVVANVEMGMDNGFFTAGNVVMSLSPTSESLILDGVIRVKDAGFINEQDPVIIKLDSYPYTRYGTISGKIIKIVKAQNLNSTDESIYKILIRPDTDFLLIKNERFFLKSGLTTTFDIINGERTIASYFLEPIFENMKEGLRER